MKKIGIVLIGLVVLIAVVITTFIIFKNINNNTNSVSSVGTNTDSLVAYESELLGVDFSKYVVESSGKIYNENDGDDYANIKFKLNSSLIDQFKNEIQGKMSVYTQFNFDTQLGKRIKEDTKNASIETIYQVFKSGKIAKTREVYAFLYKDGNDYMLLIHG
jgi:hypothetical protein